ncbi:hypothetical protein E2562_004097 [Oryza meyeriana var. granulata]|uniref:Uncharacterized protein n=1 Tax=Oryza meyeriana var. granulata TaxID=110450 RepID=A0A6G1BIS2_9ORYZ|nr:hypothetical protein E2562_004097 [Oryza meyeriana var. granulata]
MVTLRARKRGHGGSGGGDDDSAVALLGALGLGGFAGLDLHHAAPDEAELEQLAAAYDRASGRISVSLRGGGLSASPADLAAALGLPVGPVALPPEVDASVFCSEEAIAAVKGFLRDRVLLGGEGGGRELPEEVAVALRLVEEGKAHLVDWCRLFWELLKMDLVSGKPRRYAPHLLRLIEYQRLELLAEDDGSSVKRRKGVFLRACQWADEKETALIHRKCGDARSQAAEAEVEEGGQSIGDLEEMPIFGEGKEFNAVDPAMDNKSSIVGVRGWIHGMSEGNADFGSQNEVLGCEMEGNKGNDVAGTNAKDQSSPDDSSFLSLLCTMDEQDDSSSLQKVISRAKPQTGPNQQRIIEIEDEEVDDDDDNVGVGPVPPIIQNGHFGLINYFVQQRPTEGLQNDQTLPSFLACTQQIKACMDNNFLDKIKALIDARAANQRMRNMLMEKDYMIATIKRDILEDLGARHIKISRFEHDMELMYLTIQQYQKSFKNSSAAFIEYRNMMSRGNGGNSSLEVPGIADELDGFVRMQRVHIFQRIGGIQKHWLSKYSECLGHKTGLAKHMTFLSDGLQRLKDSTAIPDLNNGGEDKELDKELQGKMRDAEWEGEGDHCSSAVAIDESTT